VSDRLVVMCVVGDIGRFRFQCAVLPLTGTLAVQAKCSKRPTPAHASPRCRLDISLSLAATSLVTRPTLVAAGSVTPPTPTVARRVSLDSEHHLAHRSGHASPPLPLPGHRPPVPLR
jgi:hypothetical protein